MISAMFVFDKCDAVYKTTTFLLPFLVQDSSMIQDLIMALRRSAY